MRPCILISNSALRATGQADTYEIFPLLTLATASAGEINPLSADTGSRLQQRHTHTQSHTRLLVTTKHSSRNSTSNNSVLLGIITASADLFQLYLDSVPVTGEVERVRWHAMKVMNHNQIANIAHTPR